MSQNRISQNAGFRNPKRLPKGPSGRPLCRWCGEETKPPRRTFCSDACVHEHKLRSDPGYLRAAVLQRDGGECSSCGFQAHRAEEKLNKLQAAMVKSGYRTVQYDDLNRALIQYAEGLERRGYGVEVTRYGKVWFRTLWQADHIVPVVEGGGECGLEGIRTLCTVCHTRETAALRKRLAKKKNARNTRSKP